MTNIAAFLSSHQWQIFHEENNPDTKDPNSSLAYQDTFVRWILPINEDTQISKPTGVLHFYPLDYPAVFLGPKDVRLPQLGKSVSFLTDQGYQVVQRPHGGLAVISDPCILNFSFVCDSNFFPLSIDEGYQKMVEIVAESLADFNLEVESYEVEDSYCPGKYDLVINQRKIGGIAQRRFKSGVAVAAYISVCGNQKLRAEQIRTFYELGEGDSSYPHVNPAVMTTLSEELGHNLSVKEIERKILQVIEKYTSPTNGSFNHDHLQETYHKIYDKTSRKSAKLKAGY